MILTATKVAAGAALLGGGALAGVAISPQGSDAQSTRAAASAAPVVRTVHVKRVHRRTVHEKVHRHRGQEAEAERGGNHAVVTSTAAQMVAPATTTQQPLRTRTSGSSRGENEVENEHGVEVEDHHGGENEQGHGG